MKTQQPELIRLGIFVLSGIFLFIIALYFIGKNRGIFTNSYELKTHFRAVNGLMSGNNVRYGGIEIGAVKSVAFLNDTIIEVTLNIQTSMRNLIRKNALATLGSDGLIGNRVLNITARPGNAPIAREGDILASKEEVTTDAMIQSLSRTNDNVGLVVENLRLTSEHIRSSRQLAVLLDDLSLSNDLKASLGNLRYTTQKTSDFVSELSQTLALFSQGDGPLPTLLTDTAAAGEVKRSLASLKNVQAIVENLNQVVNTLDHNLNQQTGPVGTMLTDTALAKSLENTLLNIENGTNSFNQNMEALKHNFLFRGYFKRMERKKVAQ